MFFFRLAGGLIALGFAGAFLWTLKRKGVNHFLSTIGKLRLVSLALGALIGIALGYEPPLAALGLLVWVFLMASLSWAEYFAQRKGRRGRR